MGQQVAFVLLIVLNVMIFTQILILANNQKKRIEYIMKEFDSIKKKFENI